MTDLLTDLRARWKPTDAQIAAAADAHLAAADAGADIDVVYTAHLLLNKVGGFWTADVAVEAVPGVFDGTFKGRAAALDRAHLALGDRPGTVGYTAHFADGNWAVYEDY